MKGMSPLGADGRAQQQIFKILLPMKGSMDFNQIWHFASLSPLPQGEEEHANII